MKPIAGFSKFPKRKKLQWVVENFFTNPDQVAREMMSFWHKDEAQQQVFDDFSENTLSNYFLPFGVAPNFVINGKSYVVPMVIEESSVVAAASAGAKFWMDRGGFKAEIIDTLKVGQVHFEWFGLPQNLKMAFPLLKKELFDKTQHLTESMRNRGGGMVEVELIDFTAKEANLYQLRATFQTCDSMGANFVNTVLEEMGRIVQEFCWGYPDFSDSERESNIIMCILSNYTPNCLVRVTAQCPVELLGTFDGGMTAETFAYKFAKAVRIAHIDPYRATTHNKGIFNGIDSVVLATANDFRAIEACGHAYAARSGSYSSLTYCEVKDGWFKFWIDLPLAVGTVGGLTSLHPLAKRSLELLGNPSASELMMIIAATGLSQNFAALRALTTSGIQKGHMKMHLTNILKHFGASQTEMDAAQTHFTDKVVSFSGVRTFLNELRGEKSKTVK
jgi:hydroxymethylglutaryl-CoA reductase